MTKRQLLAIPAMALVLAACGAQQAAAGPVTFQVISDSGPAAFGDAVFASTSLSGVEGQVAASREVEIGSGTNDWRVRTAPSRSMYVALVIGPQTRDTAGGLTCVETTLTGAQISGGTLTFTETTRVVGPAGPCRTARPESRYSLVAVPLDGLGSGQLKVLVTHRTDGADASITLPADAQTSIQLT